MDAIADERIVLWLRSLNFVPWSYDNAKRLLEQGELLVVFPEQINNSGNIIPNRLKRFDWTKFMPAIEAGVPIYPLATQGIDDPKLPWLLKLIPFPASCKMRLIDAVPYNRVQDREQMQDEAKRIALFAEGEIQAEINRQLRMRSRG
jgi:1-acyl-sn-glycerol-3-phosphate acyltransferase